jgi:hypothetical protein
MKKITGTHVSCHADGSAAQGSQDGIETKEKLQAQ